MTGQRSLHRHLGRRKVADFAHHDDVGVLAHQRAQPFGEVEIKLRLHLGLVEAGLNHFNGVFNRADIDFFGRHTFQGGVQRRRLARARGPGDQNNAVRTLDQLFPTLRIMGAEAQRIQIFDRVLRVKDTHHHLLAKRGGQGGQTHFHFFTTRVAGLDTTIERAALFHHIHAPQQLDARHHGVQHAHGHLIDRVQHTVDTKADHALLAAWLQVNITGALIEGVLPQPVHHLDHALVVGIELLIAFAQLHQLLKAGGTGCATGFLGGSHGLSQCKKLNRKALDVERVRHHTAHRAACLALNFADPVGNKRLSRGNHHLLGRYLHGQHFVALGVAGTHDLAHTPHIYTQRVDAQIGQTAALRQILRQRFNVQRLAGLGTHHAHIGQPHQRSLRALGSGAARHRALRFVSGDHAILLQPLHHDAPVQRPLIGRGLNSLRRMGFVVRHGRR